MKKKHCPKCGRTRDITAFYAEPERKPDGRSGHCKDCKRKRSNLYYHSAAQVERRARDRAILAAAHAADPIAAAVDAVDASEWAEIAAETP